MKRITRQEYEDYHVHSNFSDDSTYDMEQVVQDAIAMGMSELCFTDHVDYGIKIDVEEATPEQLEKASHKIDDADWHPGIERVVLNVDYPRYFEKIEELQNKYQDQITIKTGMEFGAQSHTLDAFQKLYSRWKDKWDFILLSIHQVGDKEFWTQEFQSGLSQKEYNRAYYQEMLEVVRKFHDYSVLAHMDLIIRYDKQGPLAFEENADLIEEILKTIIADGKGLEVNTSGVRYHMDGMHPSINILRMYRDLGGTIITFGSDSHKPEHLGKYIQEQKKVLKDLGFTSYCTYDGMKPVFHSLEG